MKLSYRKCLRKTGVVFLALALLPLNGTGYAASPAQPPAGDTAVSAETISIPETFGKIEDSISGTSGKTVIFIQDAHDSLQAQENIAKIIGYAVEHYGVRSVFEEGCEGPVLTDDYFGFITDPAMKEKVSFFLMDKLRIGGAEYAHINRRNDFKLFGADSLRLHRENVRDYRQAVKRQAGIAGELAPIENEIEKLANLYFPREIKEWMKLRKRLDDRQINLPDYLNRIADLTPSSVNAYPHISALRRASTGGDKIASESIKNLNAKVLFDEIERMESGLAAEFLAEEKTQKIFEYYRNLALLARLNEVRLTELEFEAVEDARKRMKTYPLAEFIARYSKKSIALSNQWESDLNSAVRFYQTARARDLAVEEALKGFIRDPSEKVAVLVFGGFHREAIKNLLIKNGVSAVVVSPKITDHDPRHQSYYKRLMSVGYLSFETPFQMARATSVPHGYSWKGARSEIRAIYEVAKGQPGLPFPLFANRVERALAPAGARAEMRSKPGDYDHDENLDEVNDLDEVIGTTRISETRKAPYPIYRVIEIITLTPGGQVVFQQRAYHKNIATGKLDFHGNYVFQGETYESAALRLAGEDLPFSVKKDQLIRVQPSAECPYFKVRTDSARQNRAVFVMMLNDDQIAQITKRQEELTHFWDKIFNEVKEEVKLPLEWIPRAAETSPVLREKIREVMGRYLGPFAMKYYDIHSFWFKDFDQAVEEHRQYANLFADGFYAFVDAKLNKAEEASSYEEILRRHIAGAVLDARGAKIKGGQATPRPELRAAEIEETLDEVDENDRVIGQIPRSKARKDPYPITRVVLVIALTPHGEIIFQQRAYHKENFPGTLDWHGGHVKSGMNYKDAVLQELREEFPVKIRENQLVRIEPSPEEPFFKLRMPQARQNRALFILKLNQNQVSQIEKRNRKFADFWYKVNRELSHRLKLPIEKVYAVAQMKNEQGKEIRGLIREVMGSFVAKEAMAYYEIQSYLSMGLQQALGQNKEHPGLFGDGFFPFFDSDPRYPEIIHNAIERAIKEMHQPRGELRAGAYDVSMPAHPDQAVSRGLFLMKADTLAALNDDQKRELFSRLFANRSELRLVIYDEHGQIPVRDPAINAIVRLPNTTVSSEASYESEARKYGGPNALSILFLAQGEAFRHEPGKLLKAVLLKRRAGEFEFARLLAVNDGVFPGAHEENGVFDPPGDLLNAISRENLASLVVAYSA
jgi:ADP-ribose pyrophosphatase YjhB (NUDIX family)